MGYRTCSFLSVPDGEEMILPTEDEDDSPGATFQELITPFAVHVCTAGTKRSGLDALENS